MSPSEIDAIMILLEAVRKDNENLEENLKVLSQTISEMKTDMQLMAGRFIAFENEKKGNIDKAQKYIGIAVGIATLLAIIGGAFYFIISLYNRVISLLPGGKP